MKRGNLLWTGSRMMLAEHRQLLNERLKKPFDEDLKFELDEQLLEEWQEVWNEAALNNYNVIIFFNSKGKNQVRGHLIKWETDLIYLQAVDGESFKIPIKHITDFKLG